MASIYLAQTLIGKEIKVTGSFNRYRDFIFIEDVLSALMLALEDKTDNQIYNLGTGTPTTVKDLIDLILETHDAPKSEFTVTNIGAHDGDQNGNYANPSKLKALGWKPETSLKQGIKIFYKATKKINKI